MATYTKFRYLSLVLFFFALGLGAEESLRFKGDYFIYSDDFNYIYGGGAITMTTDREQIVGDNLYMEVGSTSGIIFGHVTVTAIIKKEETLKNEGEEGPLLGEETYDAVYFKGIPPAWWKVKYGEAITGQGDASMEPFFVHFVKRSPGSLQKESSLYFEFREFRINKNRRIKAKYVIPYAMGVPTMPLRSFTVRRGAWQDKTLLAFHNVSYSALNGIAMGLYLRTRSSFFKGDHKIRFFERSLFGLEGAKRGFQFSGGSQILINKKEFLGISTMLNTVEQTYNMRFSIVKDLKYFSFSLFQDMSGREGLPAFFQFQGDLTYKGLKFIAPRVDFSHDLEKSLSYRFSTPLHTWKKLALNLSWQRKIIRDTYRYDTSELATSLGFNGPIFDLTSNYIYTRNLVESTVRQNFSAHVRFKPLLFLEENVTFDISSFCNFSTFPGGEETMTRFSPGINIGIRSEGARLPLGFKLVPGFTFNHLWDTDRQIETFSDFNYLLSLQKEMGYFRVGVEYGLASRYRARDFWIEGSNRRNMDISLAYTFEDDHSLLLRFFYNNKLALETISLTGQVTLPWEIRFSAFSLYYQLEKQFQTLELFLEKTFRQRIKVQCGYSLALKRFFVKFITQ